MEKSEKNKAKDRAKTDGMVWENIPATFNRRKTGSGLTFEGRYVPKKSQVTKCSEKQEESKFSQTKKK